MGGGDTERPAPRGRGLVLSVLLAACAAGVGEGGSASIGLGPGVDSTSGFDDGEPEDGKPDNPDDEFGEEEEGEDVLDDDGPPMPPDLGPCDSDAECVLPELPCLQAKCTAGGCEHPPKTPGEICDDGDPCTFDDECNAVGVCAGESMQCVFANAMPGSCSAGECTGMVCDAGFDNCDGDWENGCETPLNTASDCGGCDEPCAAGANATADCSSGSCQLNCTAPFEDCDGDIANGCEIPTNTANQCDATGLNATNGCWTAHCGSSTAEGAVNFGSWYCYDCTTCNVPSAGQCRWCSHDTGTFFPADTCSCGAFEDLACSP